MALPMPTGTQIFEQDQIVHFRAWYWDSAATAARLGPAHTPQEQYTIPGTGVEFELFDLLTRDFTPGAGTPSARRQFFEDRFQASYTDASGSPVTRAILGYDGAGVPRPGVVPSVFQFWGAGAPVGATRAKQAVLKFSGYVVKTVPSATLVFAGQGAVYAFVTRASDGSVVEIASGMLREPNPTVDLTTVNATVIQNEWGYVFNPTPLTLNAGDKVEIYYVNNGERWGGIAGKIVNGAIPQDANFLSTLRDAPLLATSILAKEATPIGKVAIPYLQRAQIQVQAEGSIRTLQLTVPLAPPGGPDGVFVDPTDRQYNLVDNATGAVFKKGRVIHFEGGYQTPEGADELYPRFVGVIDDIFPDSSGDTALISARGFEARLADLDDENTPDYLAYHISGFIQREGAQEPVFGIPAFDNWPLETAVQVLCYQAGIDPYNLGLTVSYPSVGKWRFADARSGTLTYGAALAQARALGDSTKKILIERQVNYGNVMPLVKDYLPADDPYLFRPAVTTKLYARLKALTDQYGYDFFANVEGQFVLAGRNNPAAFQYMTKDGAYATGITATPKVAISAVGGVVLEKKNSDAAWSRVLTGHFSRLDLYAGIGENAEAGLNGGRLTVKVEVFDGASWSTLSTSTITTYATADEAYYYDNAVRADGTNAALFTILQLPFDYYRVTITPAGVDPNDKPGGVLAPNCLYRLNGVAVYERDPGQSFYYYNAAGQPTVREFSTLGNALKITTESNFKDQRNFVIVVGQRKATITDSEKVGNASNPNNPEFEFNVSSAVDPFSIYDPTAVNFAFGKRMTIIFNEQVANSDFAAWLTRTILYRSQYPPTSAKFTHTAIPTLDLRDALYVVEPRNNTGDHVVWVNAFTETYAVEADGTATALVDVEGSAYPEIPSYQPREDIDIDSLFVDPSDNVGEPVIDLTVSYKNLYGRVVSNGDLWDEATITGFVTKTPGTFAPMAADAISSGAGMSLTHPAIPSTIYLGWNVSTTLQGRAGTTAYGRTLTNKRALVNTPYRHFYNIDSWTNRLPHLTFDFQEGDGTAGVYDQMYYGFPLSGSDQWYVCYDYLPVRYKVDGVTPAENPFYDPYTSEIGNVVTLDFTLLVAGKVRVSLWARSKSTQGLDLPVAWLTNPTGEASQPEAHWQYMTPGPQELTTDLSDNIGLWNLMQSGQWAEAVSGVFGDKPNAVGAGYYAWNDKSTNLHTLIGDDNQWSAAYPNYDANGAPYFTIGQYGQFYVKIEVENDALLQKDRVTTGQAYPRTVASHQLPLTSTTGAAMNAYGSVYIWSHLGEPNQVGIRIQDWAHTDANGNLTATWAPGTTTTEADWTAYSTPDADARIAVGKPVRITFVPRARRGVLWEDDATRTSVKMTRQVHLKRTTFDQFWTLFGHPWQDFDPSYTVGATEAKRVTSRMFHNEDNTIEYEDTDWRTGAGLQAYEWIFDPSLFKKDFGAGQPEALRYADYAQLESLPSFDPKQLGGTSVAERSYILSAFINDLLYFSAFTLDRSGRRQWCLNSWTDDVGKKRGWIDKTKIVTPAWRGASDDPASGAYKPSAIVDYEALGADRYFPRSIFVRQWKETYWADAADVRSPVNQYNITNPQQRKFAQALVSNFDPYAGYFVDNANGAEDLWLKVYGLGNAQVASNAIRAKGRNTSDGVIVPPVVAPNPVSYFMRPASYGTWTFDRASVAGFFSSSPCRDFHPFMRYPYMPDLAALYLDYYLPSEETNALDALSCAASNYSYPLRDPAAQEVWFGYVWSDAFAASYAAAHGGDLRHYGPRLESTVESHGAVAQRKQPINFFRDPGDMTASGIAALYDYARQDSLDRFDQFRGVISRAPYADRSAPSSVSYYDRARRRAANAQPVKPSGTYLFNLARYDNYLLAPAHPKVPSVLIHFTSKISEWFRMQFPHEYVTYSSRYFPVLQTGAPAYCWMRTEYTGVHGWVGYPWTFDTIPSDASAILFDAGAWTGWKPDVTAATWSTNPFLRWQEWGAKTRQNLGGETLTLSGGYEAGVPATGQAAYTIPNLMYAYDPSTAFSENIPGTVNAVRANLFDEWASLAQRTRLAVGPELPEARTIVMNLSLPAALTGE